jgi:agmatine deiminase
MNNTPKGTGYYLPPEWHPHIGTWFSYPHNPLTFFDKMDAVRDAYTDIVYYVSFDEKVHINVNDENMKKDLLDRLKAKKANLKNITVHYFPTNDAWCRDHGAIFLVNKEKKKILATCWKFNSWGGKYPYDLDSKIAELMADYLGVEKILIDFVLEGGSIDTNGEGVLLTTEQCLLNPNRNPSYTKQEIEDVLKSNLGVEKVLWLEEGIVGDDTDGHIDDIARFVSKDTIVTVIEEDPQDENYKILQENLKKLKTFTDINNRHFNIVTLPMPLPIYYNNDRLPASYANFYITNNSVLVPTFNCKQDKIALEKLKSIFKDKKLIGIDCSNIIIGLGAIHCLTQQIPIP